MSFCITVYSHVGYLWLAPELSTSSEQSVEWNCLLLLCLLYHDTSATPPSPPLPPPPFPTVTIPAVYHSPGETLLLQEVHFHPHWDAPGRRLWRWAIHCNHSLLYGICDLATRTSLLSALVVSADELLPILVYLVIVCDIPNWYVS